MTTFYICCAIIGPLLLILYVYGCFNPRCPACSGRKSYYVSPSSMGMGKLRKCYCMTIKDEQKNYKEECKHIFWTNPLWPFGYTDLG